MRLQKVKFFVDVCTVGFVYGSYTLTGNTVHVYANPLADCKLH